MLSVKPVSFPLPRSLSRYAPAVRLRRADGAHRQKSHRHHPGKEKNRREKATALPFFHRLRPPDKHHRNGRSNQRWRNPTGLKDTRRFPLVAPSCALLFLPFGLPVSFRCYGRVYLIPRLTLSSGKAVRSKLDCMHEPPVQSDRCALSGNYRLESNPERHDLSPLAAATGNRIHGAE